MAGLQLGQQRGPVGEPGIRIVDGKAGLGVLQNDVEAILRQEVGDECQTGNGGCVGQVGVTLASLCSMLTSAEASAVPVTGWISKPPMQQAKIHIV